MVITKYKSGDVLPDYLISDSRNCERIYFNVNADVMSYPTGYKFAYGLYLDKTIDDIRDVFRVIPYNYNQQVEIHMDKLFIWGASQKDLTEHIKTNLDEGIICACPVCRNKFGLRVNIHKKEYPKFEEVYNYDDIGKVVSKKIEIYRVIKKVGVEGYYTYTYEKKM